jgi:hypothetical protein
MLSRIFSFRILQSSARSLQGASLFDGWMMDRSVQISLRGRYFSCGVLCPDLRPNCSCWIWAGCLEPRNSEDHDGGFSAPPKRRCNTIRPDYRPAAMRINVPPIGWQNFQWPYFPRFFKQGIEGSATSPASVSPGSNMEGLHRSRFVLEPVQTLFRNGLRHFRKLCRPSEGTRAGNEQLTKDYIKLYSIKLCSIKINLTERHMQWRSIFMTSRLFQGHLYL